MNYEYICEENAERTALFENCHDESQLGSTLLDLELIHQLLCKTLLSL